jgi:hypothetical protein
MATSPRSVVASVVGWVIVAVVLFWAFGFVLGAIRFVVRAFALLIVLGILVVVYLRLRAPDD